MIKFLEGFDSYGGGSFQSSYKWNNANVVTLNAGRFGGDAAYLDTTTLKKTITPVSGMTAGFALFLPGSGGDFMTWVDDTDSYIMDIGTNPINSLVYVTSNTTAYSTVAIPLNTWVYFEISILNFSSSAAGNIIMRMNGDQVFSSPLGFTLQGSGLGSGFTLFGAGLDEIAYDDLYICDNLGTYNTGFIEDGEILTLFPNGPGDVTDFGLVGAATNWQAVSEQPFDGDTSYVFSGTLGDQDLYTTDNMSIGNTFVIPGIAVNIVARRDNVDPIGLIPLIKSGVNLGSGTTISVTNSYLDYQGIFEREPVTSNPWTETLVNSLQIGVEV
jgi:hypothetical protein